MKNSTDYSLKLNFKGNHAKKSSQTKFLGLIIDDTLSWKAHRLYYVQIEYSMFCSSNDTTNNVH
jgi:hypothetical protein